MDLVKILKVKTLQVAKNFELNFELSCLSF